MGCGDRFSAGEPPPASDRRNSLTKRPQVVPHFGREGSPVAGTDDFVVQLGLGDFQKVEQRARGRGCALGQIERFGAVDQPLDQMIEIAEEPPVLHARLVRRELIGPHPSRELKRQKRKVDARLDGEREGAPEPAVDLHQDGLAGAPILLVFHHRDAVPADRRQQPERVLTESRIDRQALAQDARSTGRRFLAQAPVRELGDQPPSIEQREHADAGSDDALLDQRRVEGETGLRLEQSLELGSVVGIVGAARQPTVGGPDARGHRFHHGRIGHAIDHLAQPLACVDQVRARHRHAAPGGVLEQSRLVRDHVEGFEGRHGQLAVTAQLVLMRADRVRRHIGDRHQDVDRLAGDKRSEEPVERVAIVIGRGVGDVAGAVARRGGETDLLIVTDDHPHTPAPERPDDGQGGPLIAVGDEYGYRHAESTFVASWLS